MAGIGDPVAAGLVESLAHAGGNVTGITILSSDLSGKRLELLKEVVPRLSSVGVILNPANPQQKIELKEMEVAAHAPPSPINGRWRVLGLEELPACVLPREHFARIDRLRGGTNLETGIRPRAGPFGGRWRAPVALCVPDTGCSPNSRCPNQGWRGQYFKAPMWRNLSSPRGFLP
jgi:ABC transporter substrate binding protein